MEKTLINPVSIKKEFERRAMKLPGVHGVGIGAKTVAGQQLHQIALIVHVDKKLPLDQLDSANVIPKEVEGIPTDVIGHDRLRSAEQTIESLNYVDELGDDTSTYSPLVGGCRIASQNGTGYGTLGLIVRSPNNKPAILSNRHILKEEGTVYQPGRSAVPVATVTGYSSESDCAYAELNDGVAWTNYLLEIGPIQGTYDIQAHDVLSPGYPVHKRGYKTGHTYGFVTEIYYSGVYADDTPFTNTLKIVEVNGGTFAAGGDSGSVLVNDQNEVVGLNYNMYDNIVQALPIERVTRNLNVQIYVDNMPALTLVHEGKESESQNDDRCWGATRQPNHEWTSDTLLHPDDPYRMTWGPGLCMFQDKLFNIRQGASGREDVWCSKFDGRTWGSDERLAPTSDIADTYGTSYKPGMAVFRGKLYCLHKGAGENNGIWCFTYDGSQWSPDTPLAPTDDPGNWYQTDRAPAVVVYKGKLYCFHVGGGHIWCFTYDRNKWSADTRLAPSGDPNNYYGTSWTPTVVTYRGILYCIHQEKSYTSGNLLYFTYDGTTWGTDFTMAPTNAPENYYGASYGASAIVLNDRLYCIHEGKNFREMWYFTYNGRTWFEDEKLSYSTNDAPGLAIMPNWNN